MFLARRGALPVRIELVLYVDWVGEAPGTPAQLDSPIAMDHDSPPPVVVDRVYKRFAIPREQVSTLKERALHPLRRSAMDVLQALHEISFAVSKGEYFGIVGRNGSGKSTLLKCLAGIYAVDRGAIYINGRVSTFIELGVGFNPDLPSRDNVMINATMLGLSPREARRRFDSVIDFAELREFVDLKLKNYSSGMLVRLAFSTMIQVDAEILLIDEVLAVGDAAFQQKCFDEFERIRARGTTVLLVTHDMSAVQRYCDRAMLLERGHIVELGDTEMVGNRYMEFNFSKEARETQRLAAAETVEAEKGAAPPSTYADAEPPAVVPTETAVVAETRFGDGRAEIVEAWFESEDGKRNEALRTGSKCTFAMHVRFNEDIDDPLFGVVVENIRREHIFGANNEWAGEHTGIHHAGDELVVRITFENVLAPGRYHATPAIAHRGTGAAWIDRRVRYASVMVTGTITTDTATLLPFEMSFDRDQPVAAARAS
jgi:ABC-type polysaccharide/polyol phosphate transport system ATPase subunit